MAKKTGKHVKTKKGELGYTKNADPLVNGKVCVYLVDGDRKILCDPDTLKVIGYYD